MQNRASVPGNMTEMAITPTLVALPRVPSNPNMSQRDIDIIPIENPLIGGDIRWPYIEKFKPEEISDDQIPSGFGNDEDEKNWLKQYECQTCDDWDGMDVGDTDLDDTRDRWKFLVYRLPYMKTLPDGKRSCPQCMHPKIKKSQAREAADDRKDSGIGEEGLVPKTAAMNEYRLSAKDMSTLEVKETKLNPTNSSYAPMKLYDRSECRALQNKKEAEKMAKKKIRDEKTQKKLLKSASKSPRKRSGSDRISPFDESPSKPKRSKTIPPKEIKETATDDEDKDSQEGGKTEPKLERRSSRKIKRISYSEHDGKDSDEDDASKD